MLSARLLTNTGTAFRLQSTDVIPAPFSNLFLSLSHNPLRFLACLSNNKPIYSCPPSLSLSVWEGWRQWGCLLRLGLSIPEAFTGKGLLGFTWLLFKLTFQLRDISDDTDLGWLILTYFCTQKCPQRLPTIWNLSLFSRKTIQIVLLWSDCQEGRSVKERYWIPNVAAERREKYLEMQDVDWLLPGRQSVGGTNEERGKRVSGGGEIGWRTTPLSGSAGTCASLIWPDFMDKARTISAVWYTTGRKWPLTAVEPEDPWSS